MLLILLAFLGGVLTIFSPCILPVIPFVFARAEQPFRRATLPLLGGMAVTFSIFAALATAGGNWIVRTNQYGRGIAMAVLAVLGLTLLFPVLAERLTRPLVRLGSKLQSGKRGEGSPWTSFVLGASVGLLWAPCAGPILGLVLAGAALSGLSARTAALLGAFAVGAATSLAVALLAGNKVFQAMKRGLGAEEWIRRGLGALVLAGVAAIALGLDTRFLAHFSYLNTNGVEQKLASRFSSTPARAAGNAKTVTVDGVTLEDDGASPGFGEAEGWLNSAPLTAAGLRGQVVLVDFWTYSCINCLRSLPYVEAWAAKYKDQGLVVVGVHSPEFAFERDVNNVKAAVARLGVTYPVAIDSNLAIWDDFGNSVWPAEYLVDAHGEIRYRSFGEGDYDQTERAIQVLLAQAHHEAAPRAEALVAVHATGAMAAADGGDIQSPETYLGYDRAERFASPQRLATDVTLAYSTPATLSRNGWGLAGAWQVHAENAQNSKPGATISYRFHARDLHMVLGSVGDKPVRFQVTIDGQAPGGNHGADTDAAGMGTVQGQRLYQLIRQTGAIQDRTFTIQFLDAGAEAFTFTFG